MWINTATGKILRTHSDIRLDCANTSFPATLTDGLLAEFGYRSVTQVTPPTHDPITQAAHELAPAIGAGGHYEQAWEIVDLGAAAIANNQAAAAARLQADIVAAVQSRLDDFARTRNYDGILSAATYAGSSVAKFAAEGQCAVNARDATWSTLYAILAAVVAGSRPVPTGFADIEGDLPALAWPG